MTGADVEAVDVICGGFPCQDISDSGLRGGIEGERSSLWHEYARLIGDLSGEACPSFSAPWPRAGMTRSGAAFRLPSSGFPKRATECGLLPTLVRADSRQTTNGSRADRTISDGLTMTDWVRLRLSHMRVPLDLGELMMGFPVGWTELEPSATPSSRRSIPEAIGRAILAAEGLSKAQAA